MLTIDGCRARQRRLRDVLAKKNRDGALITHREHVYYFTGFRCQWSHSAAAYVDAQGRVTLVCHQPAKERVAADEFIPYPAQKYATMPMDQACLAAAALAKALPRGKRIGVDLEGPAAFVRLAGEGAADLTPVILDLRKRKDPDEIACLRAVIAISEVMYACAKEGVGPGKDELDLFAEIRAAATRAAGVDLERFGNGFHAGDGDGTPRRRKMQAGELYVIDAGPSLAGYHADNCRTFAVDGRGTEVQQRACEKIGACLKHCESQIKPGLSAQKLFASAKEFLSDAGHSGLCHHLGHGMGLQPHEAPQLNPEFEAVFEAGDVFTMEPGLYSKELNPGIRLEENYLLTETGLEKLTSFPLGLV